MSEPTFTNLEVKPLKNRESNIKASGQVTVANVLNVRFTIAEGRNGMWVKLPQHTFKATNKDTGKEETRWAKDVRIVDEDLYKQFTDMVLAEYQTQMNGGTVQQPTPEATAPVAPAPEAPAQEPAKDDKTF